MESKKLLSLINIGLLIAVIVSLSANQVAIAKTRHLLQMDKGMLASMLDKIGNSNDSKTSLSGNLAQDVIQLVVSQGVPLVYGAELGISFDNVQSAINVMKQFDPTYGSKKITLSGNDLQRYINVALRISCEYCCGAKSIINSNGEAACGCAHSQAMRGLLAYMITNHGATYSDDELLRELARWKGMYFPKQMIAKLSSQLQGEAFTPDTASLVLGLELPDYGQGTANAPIPSEIKDLPSMVGGC